MVRHRERSTAAVGILSDHRDPGALLRAFVNYKSSEVCILIVGHSRSPEARASYPSCVTAYPRDSRSRVFTLPNNLEAERL
jgi:hypothetical protein